MGIFQLPNLRFLSIRSNPYLTGYLPEFQSGSQLETLLLAGTSFSGNCTLLISLDLGSNRLYGPIPESIFRLPNLQTLDLHGNFFRGTVNVGLLRSRSLFAFQLNGNNLSVIGNSNDSVSLPKFQILGLQGCNLSGEFPSFLHGQNHLEFVELGENKIEGRIPKWFMNLGTETLWHLDLFGNFLTGFEQSVDILPWNNLRYLRLSGNKLEGALPIPPRSII
ncbi:LEUCINE-RICH REPEAT RECEPTOR PROTEIN KINASE EMS1-LIKE-RELATED, partial [Salix purpurea]